jgi:hypothetical protein
MNSRSKGVKYEFRFWRIYITAVHGSTLAAVSGFELFTNDNQTDLTTGGAGAISSSVYSASFPLSGAFDDDINTKWASLEPLPQWIGYDFGVDNLIQITGLSLTPRNDASIDQFPKEFMLQYSEDGVTWFDYAYFETSAPVAGTKQIISFPLTADIQILDISSNFVYGGPGDGAFVVINDISTNYVYGGPNAGIAINDISTNIVYAGA